MRPFGVCINGNGDHVEQLMIPDVIRSKEHLELWLKDEYIEKMIRRYYSEVLNETAGELIARKSWEFAEHLISHDMLEKVAIAEGQVPERTPHGLRFSSSINVAAITTQISGYCSGYAEGRSDQCELMIRVFMKLGIDPKTAAEACAEVDAEVERDSED